LSSALQLGLFLFLLSLLSFFTVQKKEVSQEITDLYVDVREASERSQ
jgi:hypothetical protein